MATQAAVRIEGLNRVLRALKDFPDEANAELRDEANHIATALMVPAYREAARSIPRGNTGSRETWGSLLADTVRAKRDRVPAVRIGYGGNVWKLSGGRKGAKATKKGGATPNMLRWPTASGDRGNSFAPFTRTNWLQRAEGYKPQAMEWWGDALTRVVTKWNGA